MKRSTAVMMLLALTACGGGGGGGLPPSPPPTSQPSPPAPFDDWTTYAHDMQRTGYQTQPTGITASTVGSLTLAWRNTPDPGCASQAIANNMVADEASPLVANGFVYYADVCGYVAALSRDTGSVVWHVQLPVTSLGGVLGTPTLDAANGLLIVPVHGSDPESCTTIFPCSSQANGGYLVALNAQSGAVVWQQAPLSGGNLRGEPIVVNGIVYEGLAGGDFFSGAIEGGVFGLNEMTGQVAGAFPLFQVAPVGESYDGGGSWSPISYDGRYLYFGTGNTLANDGAQDSVVRFDPATGSASPNFSIATFDQRSNDEDVGGGEMLWNDDLYFEGKDGKFYAYSLANPKVPLADVPVNTNAAPGNGAIWTPTTDGTMVAVSSGYDTLLPQVSSVLSLFPAGSGSPSCRLEATNSALMSYAAFTSGIGFTGLDNQVPTGAAGAAPAFVAFNDACSVLWKANPTQVLAYFYAGPAVVPSGVYAVDNMGNVYAWKLPHAAAAAATRATLVRPGVRSTIQATSYLRRRAGF